MFLSFLPTPQFFVTVMAANFSSSANASFSPLLSSLLPPTSTNMLSIFFDCISESGQVGFVSYTIINILLLLPLCTSVLYLGFRQWWQQRTRGPMNHIDAFTYNMSISEILNIIGLICLCFAIHTKVQPVAAVGLALFAINVNGQVIFHTMACMERFLAVVHPITYMSLKKVNGVRKRNVSIVCVWLFNIMQTGFMYIKLDNHLMYLYFALITFFLAIVSFNTLYVVCALLHSGPRAGHTRSQLVQSKAKAFYNMVVIVGACWVRFVGHSCITMLYIFLDVGGNHKCILLLCAVWLSLTTSLPLPLLFMCRLGKLHSPKNAGKLSCCIA